MSATDEFAASAGRRCAGEVPRWHRPLDRHLRRHAVARVAEPAPVPDEAWRHLQSERVRALRLTTVRAVHLPFDKRATSFVHASQPTPLVVSELREGRPRACILRGVVGQLATRMGGVTLEKRREP